MIAALPFLAACIDEDYQNIVLQGDPLINASSVGDTQMGETCSFNVNCTDKNHTALSTLKAELCFSGEVVDETVIRTKTEGDYNVSLNVPFLQYIPNGEATIRLTMQNVTTSKTIVEIPVQV